ncbi:MAG: hypothetical protein V5A22_01865 [Salinivenus sp.]
MSSPSTSSSISPSLPTDRDLDRLASAVRTAAGDRDLPERVVAWYEDWIFLFVAWCLKAPPHQIHRDRIGDFWRALTEQPTVRRWKVCQAMDALGLFFGTLGGPEALSFPGGSSPDTASEPDIAPFDGLEEPSRYLPDGELPEAVVPRAVVPTRTVRQEGTGEESERVPDTSSDVQAPGDGGPSAPKTLFNPTGGAPSRGLSVPSDEAPAPEQTGSDGDRSDASRESEDATDDEAPDDLVSVEMPRAAARRLQEAARKLDVPTAVFAARSVDLLREEVGVSARSELDTGVLLRRYQARIDLLHRNEAPESSSDEAFGFRVEAAVPPADEWQAGGGDATALDTRAGGGQRETVPTLDVRGN